MMLKLTIQTDKAAYTVGESVPLKISLKNTGADTTTVAQFFMLPADDPAKNTLKITVQDSGGKAVTRMSHILTGRALYYPRLRFIHGGESYEDFIELAGTYKGEISGKNTERALWSLGENPAVTSASEYSPMTPGTFEVQVIYHVDDRHLINLDAEKRETVWRGELTSNRIQFSIEEKRG